MPKYSFLPLSVLCASLMVGCSSDDNRNSLVDDTVTDGNRLVNGSSGAVQIVHASPDAPAVNILIDGEGLDALSNLDYSDSTGFVTLPVGELMLTVEAGGASVIESPFGVASGEQATVLAIGEVSENDNELDNLQLLNIGPSGNEDALPAGQSRLYITHAAPDAPEVDIYLVTPDISSIDNSQPGVPSLSYRSSTDPIPVPAGDYRILITPAGSNVIVFDSGSEPVNVPAGQEIIIAAVENTGAAKAESPVNLLILNGTDTPTVLTDADSEAFVRVVHAAPDAPVVDVFAGEAGSGSATAIVEGLAYADVAPATDYLNVPSASYDLAIAPAGEGVSMNVFNENVGLGANAAYTAVATGFLNTTPEFDVLLGQDRTRSIANTSQVRIVHAAPIAPTVDVYAFPSAANVMESSILDGSAGAPLLSGFQFGTVSDYLSIPTGTYDLFVVAGGAVAIEANDVQLNSGDIATVIARGPNTDMAAGPNDTALIVLPFNNLD